MNLTKNVLTKEVAAPIANASNTDTNSDRVDMSGYNGIRFITPITDCAATGVATITVEQNTADSDTGMAAITGGAATATCVVIDDLNNHLLIADVYRPQKRYVQVAITSATANIAFGNTIAELYDPIKKPVTEDTTVADSVEVAGSA